ncbi:MAG: AI-2E family transporter [Calditrichaceae bacterium]|nr:AI-2E family transporter [Calditrichaceae bacterium]MBN2709411.1 AI-2E family transporter [Calditrichaceae bacterium]RQV93538.1 MAG: AI-2E family transporter [Calditrichota bacterium]
MKKETSVHPTYNFISIALGIIVFVLFIWVLIIGRSIILPLMIALFFSFLLDPLVILLTKWKIPHGLAVTLTLLISFVVLYLLGLLVYANVEMFVKEFPVYKQRMIETVVAMDKGLEGLLARFPRLNITMPEKIDWSQYIQGMSIAQGVVSSVGTFVTFLSKTLLVIIFVAYMLIGKKNINQKIINAFPGHQGGRMLRILENITTQIQTYLGTKTLISFITGVLSIILFLIFGLDFAIFWGFIIFLFNFIPNIGSIIASILPVMFAFLQYGSITRSFWLLVFLVVVQFTIGNIVEPKLMGHSLNLSPMVVIIALIFWGYIWGVGGMILAVPILATLAIVSENFESIRFISVFIRGKSV